MRKTCKNILIIILIGFPILVWADYEKGIYEAKSGDFLTASAEFIKAAENGDGQAQVILSYMYLGALTGVVPNDEKAVKWLVRAAESGYAETQYTLARRFESGIGVPKDLVRYLKWLRMAAEQGHPQAQNDLGSNYYIGEGVETDHSLAAKWYIKSAENGVPLGQYNLALIYKNGDGITKDIVRSYVWFKLASEQSFRFTSIAKQWMNEVLSDMSIEQVKEAMQLTKELQQKIQQTTASYHKSDLELLLDDEPVFSEKISENTTPMYFRGFSVIPPSGAKTVAIEGDNRAKNTNSWFMKKDSDLFISLAYVLQVNLENIDFSSPSELLEFAKRTKATARIGQGKFRKGEKYKLIEDKSTDRICIRYELKQGSIFPALGSDLSLRYYGPYQFGIGFLCVHQHAPNVLMKAGFRGVKKKRISRVEKKQIREQAQNFLDGIVFTPLQ